MGALLCYFYIFCVKIQGMGIISLMYDYFLWHYSESIKSFFQIWQNFLWFFYNFFSVNLLLRTLFSPWKRIQEKKASGFDPGELVSRLIMNTMMRFVGFLLRLIFIIIGIISDIIVLVAGVISLMAWIFMPVIILVLLAMGIIFVIK